MVIPVSESNLKMVLSDTLFSKPTYRIFLKYMPLATNFCHILKQTFDANWFSLQACSYVSCVVHKAMTQLNFTMQRVNEIVSTFWFMIHWSFRRTEA